MEAQLKRHLLILVETYATLLSMGVTTVWRHAINDSAFQDRLQSDKTITLRTYDRAVQWFLVNWPSGSEWPEEVPRPALDGPDGDAVPAERAA